MQPGVSSLLDALPTEKGLFIHNEALKDFLDARFGLWKPVAKHGSFIESCQHHLKVDESPEAHALSCVNYGRVTARHDSTDMTRSPNGWLTLRIVLVSWLPLMSLDTRRPADGVLTFCFLTFWIMGGMFMVTLLSLTPWLAPML